jgi:hypothetical protein
MRAAHYRMELPSFSSAPIGTCWFCCFVSKLITIMAAPSVIGVGQLSSRVELMVAAQHLPSFDVLSASDPFVIVHRRVGNAWVELGRTEVVNNNGNPRYVPKIAPMRLRGALCT